MGLFRKKEIIKPTLGDLVYEFSNNSDLNLSSELFIKLISWLRPQGVETGTMQLDMIMEQMELQSGFKYSLQNIIIYLLNNRDTKTLFTQLGIQPPGSFVKEMARQINHIILPPLPETRTMISLLAQAFNQKNDFKWVDSIPNRKWIKFFKLLAEETDMDTKHLKVSLNQALENLALKVSYIGLDDNLSRQILSNSRILSPFFDQVGDIEEFIYLVEGDAPTSELTKVAEHWRNIVAECEQILGDIKKSSKKYGTSLNQSYLLNRNYELLNRMRVIVRFLTSKEVPDQTWELTASIFKQSVRNINIHNSVRTLFQKNIGALAYQIAEHKSESGEHYITTTRSEYFKFFASAAAGGFIISFAALIKVFLHKIKMPEFWQFFCYGLNYACAFVTLFITGASLATKQPAMTASALASGLDSKKNSGISYQNTALTFGKVWRSQFASFSGNLLVVFPMCYLMAKGWHLISHEHLFHTNEEALKNLRDQNPLKSLAWLYACITGLALFISGIINGYMDNKATFISLGPRIKSHPLLKKYLSARKLDRLGNYLQNNIGGIAGNICLGFMLGFAPLIGSFLGIPFDIRHITISTGYFAFGIEALDNHLSTFDWIWTTIGVLGIGFLNFATSFSLAFYVAMKSRNLNIVNLPKIIKNVGIYFIKKPLDFIFPPKKERQSKEVFPATNI